MGTIRPRDRRVPASPRIRRHHPLSLSLLIVVALVGAVVGCATGLLPGLHVNTLAVILVATAPVAAAGLHGLGVTAEAIPLAVAALLLAISVSHTFVNIIPATFLGAPDETTALSVLPAHRLLMRGHGYRAVRISAYASFLAVAASLALIIPARWVLLGPPGAWDAIRDATPVLLGALLAFLIVREPARVGPDRWPAPLRRAMGPWTGLVLVLATGAYGLLAFELPYHAFVPIPPSPLLPALGGLFGAATLLEALAQQSRVPHQFLRLADAPLHPRGAGAALGVGVAAGAGMSLLPGLTNASATAVAGIVRRATDAEILVSLGAVNTANAVFNLVVLYLFQRARSGAVVALEQVIPIQPWTGAAPQALLGFLFACLAAAWASLVLTLAIGRLAARRVHRVPYRTLVIAVLVHVTLVVGVFTGPTGLLVFAVGAALGLVPVRLGLQRTHLTGVLLVPVLSYFWT